MAIPMDRKYEKGEFIPIEKKEFGFVQQTKYQQPDLFHEEVVEIESPFAAVVASDTAVITFLVLGDQNAGKSTFLHTFTYPYDANFLELTSYLPILSSSFINTRFFFGIDSSTFQPMDELPFLDTDLGRMTVLITRENWEFFVDEFSIPRESFSDKTRFVLIQFIEIGGDHLDSLMNEEPHTLLDSSPSETPSALQDILHRSYTLLRSARETLYFVNSETLFQDKGTYLHLREQETLLLRQRFAFLSRTFPEGHQILVFLSRLPKNKAFDFDGLRDAFKAIDPTGNLQRMGDIPTGIGGTPQEGLRLFLEALCRWNNWSTQVAGVEVADHLNPDETINPSGIIRTLTLSLGKAMGTVSSHPEHFVVQHIFDAASHRIEEFHEADKESSSSLQRWHAEWITQDGFWEWLEDQEWVALPHSLLLQSFLPVAEKLSQYGIALLHFANGHSHLWVKLHLPNGNVVTWEPFGKKLSQDPPVFAIRLPHYRPFLELVQSYSTKNLPGELWLQDPAFSISRDSRAMATLKGIQEELASMVVKYWKAWLESKEKDEKEDRLHFLFWAWEEWTLAQRVTGKPSGDKFQVDFPLSFELKAEEWESLQHLFIKESSPSDAGMQIDLKINLL